MGRAFVVRAERAVVVLVAVILGSAGLAAISMRAAGAAPVTGGAYGWGDNSYRQLGDGLPVGTHIGDPTPPAGIGTGVTKLAAYGGGTFALKDGVWQAWGYGPNAEICNGAFDTHYTPTPSLIPATAKIAGGGFLEVYLDGGAAYACGDDGVGGLGDGGSTNSPTPVAVQGLGSGVVDVGAGNEHGLAVLTDGSVDSWGYNLGGQLGNGTTTNTNTPGPVIGASGVQAVAGGYEHSLALKSDGTVLAWGRNAEGEIGDNTTTMRTSAVPVAGLTDVTQIAAGIYWSMALKSDGTVWVWGANFLGQLGDGTHNDAHVPQQVAGLSGITQIEAGDYHAVALSNTGVVYTWGDNGYLQLGNSTTATENDTPAAITGLTATQVVAGRGHTAVLLPDGSIRSWGDNGSGAIGNGPAASGPHPVPSAVVAPGDAHLVAIDGGYSHSLALTDGGAVLAWGRNGEGQVGTGSPDGSGTPATVTGLSAGVEQIAASLYNASYARKSDGSVVAWGSNANGELGDGTNTGRSTPVAVTGLGGPTASIAAGAFHGLAAMADGTVRAWGSNVYGNLGDGTTGDSTTAVPVTGLSGIVQVGASDWSSYAISASGDLYAWGHNDAGQLGDGTTVDHHTPELISGIQDVVSVTGGYGFAAALDSSGTVFTWGDNQDGQLGDGTTTDRSVPTAVTLPGPATAIATGGLFTIALLADGSVYAWGFNGYGSVGSGTVNDDVKTPAAVQGLPSTPILSVGAGAYFSLAIAAPLVPDAPTIGTVTRGDASGSVAFTAPTYDGASAITGYTAACASSDGGDPGSAGGSVSPIVVSGLTNGKTYTCTVTAQNAQGSGDASLASNTFVPATVPSAPTSVSASLTAATASVSFSTPASDGGSAITGYSVSCTSTNGGTTKSGSGVASPISVAALTPGKSYTCSVTASNDAGSGAASGASNTVTVANVPGAPTGVTAVTGATATTIGPLTVSFTAPASNGGSAITGYTATCTSSNGGVARSATASAGPITVTGATTGKSYACSVKANNAIGSSAASAASAAVVVGAPAAPTGVTVDPAAGGSLAVSFTAGANNGAAITSFTATCVSSNGGATSAKAGTASPLTVTGLTLGKTYTCTVKATNSRGAGPASVASAAVSAGAPDAPANVKAVSGSTTGATGSLTVTFTAPANNGAAITGYTATCVSSNGGATSAKAGAGSPLVVTGVTTAKTYTCSVRATNSRGAGPPAGAPGVIVGSPAAPTGVTAVKVATGALRVTFTAGANNGAAVSSYAATCTSSNGGVTSARSGAASPLTVTGLSAGKAYTCTVTATNARGAGLASAASASVNA